MLVVGGGPAGAAAADLRRPQGHPHRRRRRALRRPGARHDGDRELHLGALHRGPEAGRRARAARQGVRRRRHGPASGPSALVPGRRAGRAASRSSSRTARRCRPARSCSSTGARWRQMGVPGEDEYRNKGVTYCPHCDGPLFKGKRVAVIGGGNSGVEAAIDLAGVVAHVTLIEFDGQLRADEVLQRKLRSLPNVDVVVSALTTEVVGDGDEGHRPRLRGPRHRRDRTRSTSTASSCRSACCPTPSGSRARVELSPRGEIVDRRPRPTRRCPACSPPATARRCRTSRS